MVNMKMSEDERKEAYGGDTVMAAQPLYPWGLCITLDDDALEKLKLLKNLPKLDEVIEFKCKAQVVRVNSSKDYEGEDESSLGLQITEMEVESRDKDIAQKLYGGKGGE